MKLLIHIALKGFLILHTSDNGLKKKVEKTDYKTSNKSIKWFW